MKQRHQWIRKCQILPFKHRRLFTLVNSSTSLVAITTTASMKAKINQLCTFDFFSLATFWTSSSFSSWTSFCFCRSCEKQSTNTCNHFLSAGSLPFDRSFLSTQSVYLRLVWLLVNDTTSPVNQKTSNALTHRRSLMPVRSSASKIKRPVCETGLQIYSATAQIFLPEQWKIEKKKVKSHIYYRLWTTMYSNWRWEGQLLKKALKWKTYRHI